MNAFVQGLFQAGLYKRSQGRIARQLTFVALAVLVSLGAWSLKLEIGASGTGYGVSGLVLFVGLWVSYRLVNMPNFADFLISVEAEMNKVSWPSRDELIRSSLVVIFTILFLAALLYAYDFVWRGLLGLLGI